VTGLRVALLTEEWLPLGKESRIAASVRLVADRAILRNRRVFPEIGTALLGVAGEAGVVEGAADECVIGDGAVRVVAVAAGHAILAHRVRIRQEALCPLPRMAAHAGFRLCRLGQHGVVRRVNLVTTHTRHAFALVRAAWPPVMYVVAVTAETCAVLLLDRCG